MGSLENVIEKDNPVRFVDAFIEHLDLSRRVKTKLQKSFFARKTRPFLSHYGNLHFSNLAKGA